MAQVLIVGRKRDSLEVVRALQDVGVVQIDPLDSAELERSALAGADAERRAVLERQLARVESILAALGNPQVAPAPTRLKSISDLGSYLEEVGHRADVLVRERAELESELATTGTYRQVARAAAELAGNLDRSERVAVLAFTADAEDLTALRAALDANLGAPYEIGTRQAGAVTTGVLAVRRRDEAAARALLGRAGVSELRLGGRFANLPYSSAALLIEERSRTGPEELLGVREGLENIAREHAPTLVAARYELRDEIGRYAAIEAGARGRYGFALRGWLPVANKPALESALAPLKNQVLYQFEAPDLHHAEHVPVKLENNAFVKPFELLMGIFAPPGYGTYDPTWVIALFFPIFFGFVIGDIGLGLLFLLLALVLRGRANAGKDLNLGMLGVVVPPKPLRSVATILTWMSLWSIVFGFVYGEVFGTLGERMHWFAPAHHAEAGAAQVDAAASELTGTAAAGTHTAGTAAPGEEGHAEALPAGPNTGAAEGSADHATGTTDDHATGAADDHAEDAAHAADGKHKEAAGGIPILLHRVDIEHYAGTMLILALIPGIIQILYGWLIRLRIGLAHGDRKHIFEGLGMFVGLVGLILYAFKYRNPDTAPDILVPIALACLAVFLVCVVLSGVFMMLIELLSNGGNILSYLRLFAVGLSSALLANLATDTGWGVGALFGGGIGQVIGIIVGVIIATFIHTVALALTIIGHVLQPLRLHYAEFFTKFGFFDSSGRPYRPFARSGGIAANR